MNDKFKELLPNPFAVDYTTYDDPMDLYREQELEKFANLIIQECIRIADSHGAYEVMDDIIEYFGVEE